MVRVPAGVVADRRSLLLGKRLEDGQDVLDRFVCGIGVRERRVRLLDVCRVVLVVVHLHRSLVYVGLESVVVVGERWDSVLLSVSITIMLAVAQP